MGRGARLFSHLGSCCTKCYTCCTKRYIANVPKKLPTSCYSIRQCDIATVLLEGGDAFSSSHFFPAKHLHYNAFISSPAAGGVELRTTSISVSVCLSVCPLAYFTNHTPANFTKFPVGLHVTCGRCSSLVTTVQYVMYIRFCG